jgi:hypothetical protein
VLKKGSKRENRFSMIDFLGLAVSDVELRLDGRFESHDPSG